MKDNNMKYYVYELIDPRNEKPFYIGCGQKNRMYRHEKDVLVDRVPNGTNKKLGNKIKQILATDSEIKYKKVFKTENNKEVFTKEIELIAKIGLENLCNLTEGGEGNTYWLGKKHSEESKRKISESKKGHKVSIETRKKISNSLKGCIAWNKGKIHSDEVKQKISNSLFGRISPMKGKHHTEETKRKMSKSMKGINTWMKGKHHSLETRKKISESLKKRKSESTL